jgi:hypothetical protein
MINSLLRLIITLGNIVLAGIVAIELWVRGQLAQLGVPKTLQTVILVTVAILLIIASLRIFGGLIRVALVLVLVLIGLHILAPLLVN